MSTESTGEERYGERASSPRPRLPVWAWAIAAASIFVAAVIGVTFAPVGAIVAVWWPAAGIAVLFALLQAPTRMPAVLAVVVVATALANLVAGRTPLLALALGVANAAEVAVIIAVLGAASRRFELSTLRAGVRFALAVVLGACATGLVAGAAVALLAGGALLGTALSIAASHAAAVVLIAPLGALPTPVPVRASRIEMLLQSVLLLGIIVLVFSPDSPLPLAFAPFPLLAWAALRFPIRMVLAQAIAGALVMLLMTVVGGPFRDDELDLLTGAALFEAMLVTFGGFAVVLSAAQYELRSLARQVDATNRLLTGSVIDARIGLVVAERSGDAMRVTWANRVARRMLGDAEVEGESWSGPLRSAALRALRTGEPVTVDAEEDRAITVAANPIDGAADRVAVQLIDVTAILRARRAQVAAEVEIEATRSIRAELERQRDDFLLTTSHELRTPITSIVGYAELLADGEQIGSTERGWVRVIERNARRLSELVEDLLTFSRGSRDAPPLHRERVRCDDVLDEVIGNLRVVLERKRIAVSVEPCEHAVRADRHDAIRMLSNLLVNACKFTPEGGSISLRTEADGTHARMVITDSGPGMAAEELEQAFERFYRAPSAERENVEGTGLGLAIVAELARRNDGTVALRAGESGGLTAELRLPLALDDA
ncbi:ATP-binding protein [Agrococcus sp. Marseille-P2731]|uniref:ATP-binding protein n=1 Tax=Agrococcus sp. Marseille-P2731 TaxID=1841862 RepID=UPI00092FFBF0|nr:ATP-binding protein [Agrococcus sp. Marseille-P2731]